MSGIVGARLTLGFISALSVVAALDPFRALPDPVVVVLGLVRLQDSVHDVAGVVVHLGALGALVILVYVAVGP